MAYACPLMKGVYFGYFIIKALSIQRAVLPLSNMQKLTKRGHELICTGSAPRVKLLITGNRKRFQ